MVSSVWLPLGNREVISCRSPILWNTLGQLSTAVGFHLDLRLNGRGLICPIQSGQMEGSKLLFVFRNVPLPLCAWYGEIHQMQNKQNVVSFPGESSRTR